MFFKSLNLTFFVIMFNGNFTLECKLIMLLYDFSCLESLLYEYDSSKLYIMLDGAWK
jgi:hypothetical protein